jgi:hypothetical protein
VNRKLVLQRQREDEREDRAVTGQWHYGAISGQGTDIKVVSGY